MMSAQGRVDPMPNSALTPQNFLQPTFEYIFEMPLDIILEIFSFLHPYDLLRLARTNKDLRQMLMSRSYNDLWKKCMAGIGLRIDDGFESYQRATEPALINMLFCTACTFCGQGRVNRPTWSAICRCCDKCSDIYFATPHDMRYVIHSYFREHDGLWDCLPYTLHEDVYASHMTLTNELWQLSNAEEKEAWMREKRDKAIEDGWRVKACRDWMEAQMHDTRSQCSEDPEFASL